MDRGQPPPVSSKASCRMWFCGVLSLSVGNTRGSHYGPDTRRMFLVRQHVGQAGAKTEYQTRQNGIGLWPQENPDPWLCEPSRARGAHNKVTLRHRDPYLVSAQLKRKAGSEVASMGVKPKVTRIY